MKGQGDIEGIIGLIISGFLAIMIIIAFIPAITSISGQPEKDRKIQDLTNANNQLAQESQNKDIKITELNSLVGSLNSNITDKDRQISNLTGQIAIKDTQIANLSTELNDYKERQYLTRIDNYFYNISNSFTNIENRFFPIEITVSLLSLSLLVVVVKIFGVVAFVKSKLPKQKVKETVVK